MEKIVEWEVKSIFEMMGKRVRKVREGEVKGLGGRGEVGGGGGRCDCWVQ